MKWNDLPDVYLTESDEFPDLLRYCNIMYNVIPLILRGILFFRTDKSARKLAAICVVTGG